MRSASPEEKHFEMNPEYERELELEIDGELKRLPELEAPAGLSRRVLLAIAERRTPRWFNQPWQNWPMVLRGAALAVLSLAFGALCVASWQLTKAAGVTVALEEVGGLFSGLATIWNVVTVLGGAVVIVVKHLGTGFIVGCATFAALGYALCLGLGTAYLRLAFARR
jgi:hypothetical protein